MGEHEKNSAFAKKRLTVVDLFDKAFRAPFKFVLSRVWLLLCCFSMKKWIVFSTIIIGSMTSTAFAQSSMSPEQAFLERLGFISYTQEIDKTLQKETLTPITARVLNANRDRYEVVDLARNLSLTIYNSVFPRLNDPAVVAKTLKLTAHLLRPHALLSDVTLPQSVLSKPNASQFADARDAYLTQIAQQRFDEEQIALLSTVVDLVQTNSSGQPLVKDGMVTDFATINQLKTEISKYTQVKYAYMEMQNTQYWGRAMAALMVRYSRLYNHPEVEQQLQALLVAQDDTLGNYLSSTLQIRNDKNQIDTINLRSGDFANEYSHGTESYYITIGVKPAGKNSSLAKKENLVGSLLEVLSYPTPDEEDALVAKYHQHLPMTDKEQKKMARVLNSQAAKGYSHVGMVQISQDAQTGIAMPWIWDVYPNSSLGGIRFIGPEGFAFSERFQKVGFVQYDSQKFMSYYKQTIAKRGYQKNVWDSFVATVDDTDAIAQTTTPIEIQTFTTPQEVQYMASFPDSQADVWFSQQLIPRVLKTMHRYLVSEDAMAFATGFADVKGAAYCSEAMVLAYLQGADIDPEQVQDKWSDFMVLSAKFNVGAGGYFSMNKRIISPSGFAWQAGLVQYQKDVYLNAGYRRSKDYDVDSNLLQYSAETRKAISDLIICERPDFDQNNVTTGDDDL